MSGLWWLSVREHRRMTWSASRSHHPTTTQRCTHQPTTTQTHGCPSVVNLNQHMAALYCECLQITNKTPMIHKLSIWKPNDRLKWANWSKNRKNATELWTMPNTCPVKLNFTRSAWTKILSTLVKLDICQDYHSLMMVSNSNNNNNNQHQKNT